jgi:uncharacterized RDD family membrane protein YckC
MKCPKCGYVGFETGSRCRNCGYEFSLLPSEELPMRPVLSAGPDDEVEFGDLDTAGADEPGGGLDLDRLIGVSEPEPPAPLLDQEEPPPVPPPGRAGTAPDDLDVHLPLFEFARGDDGPLIAAPGPPRPPLAVRRATPEVPRARARTTRPFRPEEPELDLTDGVTPDEPGASRPHYVRPGLSEDEADAAGPSARLVAALIDLGVLASVNGTVVYLTMQIAGLGLHEAGALPVAPMAAFLALLTGGYLVAFTAASGQTLGKMATGIRVVDEEGRRVDPGRAVLRAAGSLISLATLGAGFLPALMTRGGRALHDRLAGTRVVRE